MARTSNTLKDLRECIAEKLIQNRHLSPAEAADLASDAVAAIQERYRGDAIYIGVGRAELEDKRNWLIWEDFNGSNQAMLARKYSGWNGLGTLTERRVYQIIDLIRPLAIGKVQCGLFE